MRFALMVGVLAALVVAVGCGDDSSDATAGNDRLAVVAAFYPIEEAAREVGGNRVDVFDLTPAGGEPHDIELSADAVGELEGADAVLYLGQGFQPSVEKAVGNLGSDATTVDLLTNFDLRAPDSALPGITGEVDGEVLSGNRDPHVWVDPKKFGTIVEGVRDALIAADPDGESAYQANADAYLAQVNALDSEFATGLEACRGKPLVTSHAAFGYLTDRYGLIQAPIAGISPEEEPDPKSLAATAAFAKREGVKTVYFETLVPKDLAQTVADEIGAKTDALDPVEGIPQDQLDAGATYLSIQRDNLARLVSGLGCTTG